MIGFNARPILASLRRFLQDDSGLIAVVDYFGDIECRNLSDILFSVLKQESNRKLERNFHRSPADYLVELAEILSDEIPIEKILIGGGLDDRPDLWQRISDIGTLLGNKPELISDLRNREKLYSLAKRIGFRIPDFEIFNEQSNIEDLIEKIGIPCIVRRLESGGGLDIYRCNNKKEAIFICQSMLSQYKQGAIMSYEQGIPSSVCTASTSFQTTPIAYNEQLLRTKGSFCPYQFGYCGNITPMTLSKSLKQTLDDQFSELGEKLGILGLNGFDFVLNQDEACIIELNPRFQGSLEPIELSYDINLVSIHYNCFFDQLPNITHPKRVAVRKILYTPEQVRIPDFSELVATDRPIKNVILQKGSPMISVLTSGYTKKAAINEAMSREKKIWKMLEM